LQNVEQVAQFYQRKRDVMLEAAQQHLQGLAEWNVPKAGMFLWLRLIGVDDAKALVEQRAIQQKVILLPGKIG
jgi:kynurenine/2-aminoadipate aminotransferase